MQEAAAQSDNLGRVSTKLGTSILEFCRQRFAGESLFRMSELTSCISAHQPVAPDSPGRILRYLRSQGLVSYVVVNRAQSLYRLTGVRA
jgi:hypothetical protein